MSMPEYLCRRHRKMSLSPRARIPANSYAFFALRGEIAAAFLAARAEFPQWKNVKWNETLLPG